MMGLRRIQYCAAVVAVVAATVHSPAALAAAANQLRIHDVALAAGNRLHGQVLGAEGAPAPGVAVILWNQNAVIARTASGQDGQFDLPNLPGGVYLLEVAGQRQACRLWAPHTAPPQAKQGILVLANEGPVVRGNKQLGNVFDRHPWSTLLIMVGIVGGALAISISEHDAS